MKIACLAWGSLIWDPQELPVEKPWFNDGPSVRVEFVRKSREGKISLVLCDHAKPVQSLWALMSVSTAENAIDALRIREGIPKSNISQIGFWKAGQDLPLNIINLSEWARSVEVEAVIWTGLPPKFEKNPGIPSCDEIVAYLLSLNGKTKELAEEYVRKAPAQINTEYRSKIEAQLRWTHEMK